MIDNEKKINYREADLGDLPELLRFEQEIIKAERPYDATLKEDPISYYDLANLLQSDQALVLLAECDDGLIASGFARIESSKPYLTHRQHGYLGFMFVAERYRGKGINKQIIQRLAAWLKSKHVYEMSLDVYSDNEAAVRAYQKAGFKKNLIEMRMEIK
ncbi:MAG: GNAT family N-acetyltransferase [Calditrichaeota bacterium]|nr:GNAT family N-acetyltransferase [Calditrichota bacterium]